MLLIISDFHICSATMSQTIKNPMFWKWEVFGTSVVTKVAKFAKHAKANTISHNS